VPPDALTAPPDPLVPPVAAGVDPPEPVEDPPSEEEQASMKRPVTEAIRTGNEKPRFISAPKVELSWDGGPANVTTPPMPGERLTKRYC
jgi:hypothetical protein